MGKHIMAKDVYVFSQLCVQIQHKNDEFLKNEIDKLKKDLITHGVKKSEKKKIKEQVERLKQQRLIVQEKIDCLENTMSIVLAVYEKQGREFKFKPGEEEELIKEYRSLIGMEDGI